jgi:UDP-N-acetylmuramoyl-tripeptide--D-alanyl-D-alanine ligase
MKIWSIPVNHILEQGDFLQDLSPDFHISQFSWDSRSILPGDTFFCLSGDNFNGHKFARSAIDAGAAAVVAELENEVDLSGLPVIYTKNVQNFLWRMGRFQRDRFNGKVIAITGSNGKTSTRRMATALGETLLGESKVHATPGNKNNHLGLPFTLIQLQEEHELAVLEIGTNHPGEIRPLVDIAQPHGCIITGIGGGHIGNFSSWLDLAKEKCSIAHGLKKEGVCIIPPLLEENTEIQTILNAMPCKYFSPSSHVDILELRLDSSQIKILDEQVLFPFPGRHMISNFELVLECFLQLGYSHSDLSPQIIFAFDRLFNEPGRLQVRKKSSGLQILDDSYNANAESVLAALRLMVESSPELPKGLFLGEMGELGEDFEKDHLRCLRFAQANNFSLIALFLNDESYKTKKKLFVKDAEVFNRNDEYLRESVEELLAKMSKNGVLLVKGSRSAKMDSLPGLNL